MPKMQQCEYTVERNGAELDLHIIYSLDIDTYEGTCWVDIHRIIPEGESLTKNEMRELVEDLSVF